MIGDPCHADNAKPAGACSGQSPTPVHQSTPGQHGTAPIAPSRSQTPGMSDGMPPAGDARKSGGANVSASNERRSSGLSAEGVNAVDTSAAPPPCTSTTLTDASRATKAEASRSPKSETTPSVSNYSAPIATSKSTTSAERSPSEKRYHARRNPSGGRCDVWINEFGVRRDLNARLDLVRHSPDGFGFGYGGSGPSQLALAMCADALGDDDQALRVYQAFKNAHVALQTADEWEISADEVRAMVHRLSQGS